MWFQPCNSQKIVQHINISIRNECAIYKYLSQLITQNITPFVYSGFACIERNITNAEFTKNFNLNSTTYNKNKNSIDYFKTGAQILITETDGCSKDIDNLKLFFINNSLAY